MNKPLILVVEDDNSVKNLITTTLKAHNYRFVTAPNASSAILEASSHNPDIVLLDLGLPDIDLSLIHISKRGYRQNRCTRCRSRRLSDQTVFGRRAFSKAQSYTKAA